MLQLYRSCNIKVLNIQITRSAENGEHNACAIFSLRLPRKMCIRDSNKDELREAADLIIAGKPVYQGIWMDQILEKLPSEEIVAAPYYNGDAVTMIDENPDLAFYVPKEGTNLFVDAMCIPKNAKNVSGAEKFINFMCSTEAATVSYTHLDDITVYIAQMRSTDQNTGTVRVTQAALDAVARKQIGWELVVHTKALTQFMQKFFLYIIRLNRHSAFSFPSQ